MGSRAIYKDGWKAGTLHKKGEDFSKDKWELYNLTADYNELHDLASSNPDKLKELQDLFDSEAAKYNIYPLKDGTEKQLDYSPLYLNNNASRTVFYPEASQVFGVASPITPYKSYTITADAEIQKGSEGVLFALGGRFGGVSLFVKEGKLYAANNTGVKLTHLVSSKPLPAGKVVVKYVLNYKDAKEPNDAAGTQELYINDTKVAEAPIVKAQANIRTGDEINVGKDLITQVSDRYKGAFTFTGKINQVIVDNAITTPNAIGSK
jgi:arylsulfatase